MTFKIPFLGKKQRKEEPERVPYTGYDLARAGLRTAYTTLPPAAYAATSEKLGEVENLSLGKRAIAELFYNGDIENLLQLNEIAAEATGVGAALASGYAVDTIVEKLLPSNEGLRQTLRKPAQILGHLATANIANAAVAGPQNLYDLIKSTFRIGLETLTNFSEATSGSDLETMANMGITTLLGISAIKGADHLARSKPAKAVYNLLKRIYNHNGIIGKDAESYEKRRSRRDLAQRKNKLTEAIRESEKEEARLRAS